MYWIRIVSLIALAIASQAHGQQVAAVAIAASPPMYDGAKIIKLAEDELGTFKVPGTDDSQVKKYCTSTYQNDDVYSNDGWCSAFVSYIEKEAGNQYSPNNTDFGWMYVVTRVADPKAGDIAMLDSHIAFYIGRKQNAEGNWVIGLLGGNQDYQVCVMWVPESDIEYYAEANAAGPGWVPQKHIPNGTSVSNGINVLNDSINYTTANVKHTKTGHPL
jgi:hypothetical protein